MNGIKECDCLVGDGVPYWNELLPQCWCRCSLVFNVRGNILGLPRERLAGLELLPTFGGDDMAPLFESSRANELLLIHSACFLVVFSSCLL